MISFLFAIVYIDKSMWTKIPWGDFNPNDKLQTYLRCMRILRITSH
jgi:hypothetical protein